MTQEERTRVRGLWHDLRGCQEVAVLRQFAGQDMLDQARTHHLSLLAMAKLRQYARCRAGAMVCRRLGDTRHARRDAALAGVQARYFARL